MESISKGLFVPEPFRGIFRGHEEGPLGGPHPGRLSCDMARLPGWPWVLLCPHSLVLNHFNCPLLNPVHFQGPLGQQHVDLKPPPKEQRLHVSGAVQTCDVPRVK